MIELSELQLSLLLAGAVLIVSIWLVNRMQLRRIQRQQNKTLSENTVTQRCEPTLHSVNKTIEDTLSISRTTFTENEATSIRSLVTAESNIFAVDQQPPESISVEQIQNLRKIAPTQHTDLDSAVSMQPAVTTPLGKFYASPEVGADPISGMVHESSQEAVIGANDLPSIMPDSQHSEALVEHTSTIAHANVPDNDELNVLTNLESSLLDSVAPIIDPIIDCVIDLPLDYPLSSERILPLLKHLRHAGNKPIYCEGFNLTRQARELVRAGQGYRDLSIAVQLANRHGPISAIELSEFISGVQKLAKSLEIAITTPDLAKVLTQAQTLDTYAQQNDVQICLHIETSQQPWLASQLKAQFEQDGLLLSHHGMHYHYYHDKNAHTPIFILSFGQINFLYDDLTHIQDKKVTLYFHAPHVAQGIQAFRLTWSYAQHLATILGGKIVDDVGTPLSDKAIKTIEQHLCELYARLNRYGIPVGSTNALRLFSPA